MTGGEVRLADTSAEAFLRREREKVDAALAAIVGRCVPELPVELREAVEYALSTAGKRLRPILCVAAHQAAARVPPPGPVYDLACSLEIVHTYSLVHDDLPSMDDDDLRRGRPTLHRVFGTPAAIVAGAALLPLAIRVIEEAGRALGLPVGTRALLVRELAMAAGAEGMVGGQLLDLDAEGQKVSAEVVETIHRRKTGALLTAALRMGAIAGQAPPPLLESLTRYGRALGLAFQIADDVLDVEGVSLDLGKTAGRDAALKKASYPALYGVTAAREHARARAAEACGVLRGLELPELELLAEYVVERRS